LNIKNVRISKTSES